MDEIKHKFRDFLDKRKDRNTKIPSMGFTDNYSKKVPSTTLNKSHGEQKGISGRRTSGVSNNPTDDSLLFNIFHENDDSVDGTTNSSALIPDQEILDSTESIYFLENADTNIYELKKFIDADMDVDSVQRTMQTLKQQHKVISKKVLQNILEKRNPCNNEIKLVQDTDVLLQESLLECKKARSYLSCAKKNLTTTSLHILSMYKKRETMHDILQTLYKLKKLKSTELQLQKLLELHNYSNAIALLLECKRLANENSQYVCVTALSRKLQNTLMTVELQLDEALAQVPHSFDVKQYTNLQEAYRLLGKSVGSVDQLHINFISSIHTMAFNVLKEYIDRDAADDRPKYLYEEMCANISSDNFIPCLIKLCKSFWCMLVCYYQVAQWHQNAKPLKSIDGDANGDLEQNDYIQQKFKSGYNRIWSDIQAKLSLYLSTNRTMHTLKYEQFIQVLSIVQRLRKVGMEFCNEPSTLLMESMKSQCVQFFQRYHKACLDEIRLFLDNEAWMPVHSFNDLLQLQEYSAVRSSLERFMRKDTSKRVDVNRGSPSKRPLDSKKSMDNQLTEENLSNHSQEDCSSSVYGSCGYFLRFSEKSSPFDGGFDKAMLEEDILAGIADESSCYFSEESEEEPNPELQSIQDNVTTTTTTAVDDNAVSTQNATIIVNNSSLNVLRCIGRYLQMCKLLHSIAPQIVKSMTELIEFYVFVVHEFFAHDLPLSGENLYSNSLRDYLRRVSYEVVAKVDNWKSDVTNIQHDLKDPDTAYGLLSRIVAIESAITLVQQFAQIREYLNHLLQPNDSGFLNKFFDGTATYLLELRKPIYMCVAARVIDLNSILASMNKVKFDINHVNVEHSGYVNNINRGLQAFAMRLEEIEKTIKTPREHIWNCLAHVITHTFVEGYANAKKCTPGGRALMQLDFTHFMSIMELLSGEKFPEHHRYVDSYIKAYYFPKDLLETWIQEEKAKRAYSSKHLLSLITCTCSNDKKMRQKLIAILEQDANASFDLNVSNMSIG